jgi:hypothetical protein
MRNKTHNNENECNEWMYDKEQKKTDNKVF